MANVLMPVMVALDCGRKRQSLTHFLNKQEKHRGAMWRFHSLRVGHSSTVRSNRAGMTGQLEQTRLPAPDPDQTG
jgi:hypothetical protein